MGSRRKSRIVAFQSLYAWDIAGQPLSDLVSYEWMDEDRRKTTDDDTLTYASYLVAGTIENIDTIDKTIQNQALNWDLIRIAKTDLAILRMSVYSLMFQPDIPPKVVIDEAIDIIKRFSTDDSYKFVNGVLDGIRKAGIAVIEPGET